MKMFFLWSFVHLPIGFLNKKFLTYLLHIFRYVPVDLNIGQMISIVLSYVILYLRWKYEIQFLEK